MAINFHKTMTNALDRFPLVCDDIIKIYEPNITFYLEKIRTLDHFSMIRFPDQWWKAVGVALSKVMPSFDVNDARDIEGFFASRHRFIDEMAPHLVSAGTKNPYVVSEPVMIENMKTAIRPPPANLYFTAKAGRPEWRQLIKAVTRRDTFLHAHSCINFATTGEIHQLFSVNLDYHFIVVAPFFYKNFGNKLALKNFSFVGIHETHGHKNIDRTIAQITAQRKSIKHKKVICLFSAGALSTFMIAKLHRSLPDTFWIDVGRALDAYYCHDDVLLQGPQWRWSNGWFGPQEELLEWTQWTLKYRS